jgi:FKBP-type peptidyl-prolyl cis-trans isomerase
MIAHGHYAREMKYYLVKKYGGLALGLVVAASLYARPMRDSENREKTNNSYAYGLVIGSDLKNTGIEFDYPAITEGLRDAIEGRDARMTVEEAITLVQRSFMAVMERQAEENRQKETLFLAENGKRQGVITTESGLQYEVVRTGEGTKPDAQAVVRVNYEGKLTDGTVFDSSYERGQPADIPLDRVIPGWSEGICLMGEGDSYILYIPSHLAYGERGAGDMIPPNATLIFRVELLEILNDPDAQAPGGDPEDG